MLARDHAMILDLSGSYTSRKYRIFNRWHRHLQASAEDVGRYS